MVLSNQRQAPTRAAGSGDADDPRSDARSPVANKFYIKGSDLLLPDEPRLSVLWRAKWTIAACAVLAAVLAAAVASLPQTQYSAQATIRVSLPSTKGVPRELVLAQNDLAAQYALLASTQPVLEAAAKKVNGQVGTITATPVNGYNIVGITAVASSPAAAAKRASAVAESLVTYVADTQAAGLRAANETVAPQLQQLDTQIRTVQASVERLQNKLEGTSAKDAASGAQQALLSSQLSLLGTLVANRTNFTAATRDAAAAAPRLTLLDVPASGTEEPKNQLVYGLVALLVGALGAAEITVLAYRLRTLSQTSSGPRRGTPPRPPAPARPEPAYEATRGVAVFESGYGTPDDRLRHP